ncbi:MAG TPA: SCO family protein [Gemmatimonadales bacterium]|nr:SCO family protein [Gemmatimonadales bacterium]
MRRREWGAAAALGSILVVTAAWWALALWPLPDETPAWLVRARLICFGTGASGLPDAAGWLMLIGQPVLMLVLLLIIWGDALAGGVVALSRRPGGRVALFGAALLVAGAGVLAGVRVAGAADPGAAPGLGRRELPATYPRLHGPAPDLPLVDQYGDTVRPSRFRGRPVLVTFAYAHCETVCPIAVREVLAARQRASSAPPVLIITLDPWRDTPARLPHIARAWSLPPGAHVLSGAVGQVEAALDAWNVARERDLRSGAVAHPAIVLILDSAGRLAYAAAPHADAVAQLLGRL